MISSSSVARRFGQLSFALLVVITAVAFGEVLEPGCDTTHAIVTDCQQQLTEALRADVANALDVDAWEGELLQLVASSSLCAVDAILAPIASSADAGAALGAAVNTSKALRAQRARQWLQKHPAPG